MKISLIIGLFFCLIGSILAKDFTSQFKACRDRGISLNDSIHSFCNQKKVDSFKEMERILGLAKVMDFQKRIQDKVKVKLEIKIYELELLQACASKNETWFKSRSIDLKNINKMCGNKIEEIQKSVKERFPKMRQELALSSSNLRESQFLKDKATWIKTSISHGTFSGFSKLNPISSKEKENATDQLSLEVATELIRRNQINSRTTNIKMGVAYLSLNELLNNEKKKSENISLKDEVILANFLKNSDQSYAINGLRSFLDQSQKKHRENYFQLLNQMPLLAFINDYNLDNPDSPSASELSQALSKTHKQLSDYYKDLNQKNKNWEEYAQYTYEIEQVLNESPEYCSMAETLLSEKQSAEDRKLYTDLSLAAVAAVPCFMAGPVSSAVCIGSGLAVGTKGVIDAKSAKDQSLGFNMTDFLGKDGTSNFLAYDQKQKDLILQSVFLPLGAFGGTSTTGRAVVRSYQAYDDVGRFITKSEGLDFANNALKKLIESKNFDKLSEAERMKLFDKLLADEVLPKHLLSFLEKKQGGFKLIDTNYDFDAFPPELLEKLSAKLGSKDDAMKFIKNLYHRHVLDHHGSMGNVENATQQVISEFEKRRGSLLVLQRSNPVKYKIELEKLSRELKKEYFRVSTDNLGDGQLATYLIRHHTSELMTNPNFANFMKRVANIEDFEAFGPGLYQKYQKAISAKSLTALEKLELEAINTALARQKAINDTLLKYGTDKTLPDGKVALLFADRFNHLPPEIQKKIVAEVDDLTTKILKDPKFRDQMAKEHFDKVIALSGSEKNPGLVRLSEVSAKSEYAGIPSSKVAQAKDEIFAFNASKLRSMYETQTGKKLGPFDVFHAPVPVLNEKKKILVSISESGEKRTFVVAFGNGLRNQADTLKSMAKEIHLVEKRTLENLIKTTSDPSKIKTYQGELEAVTKALNAPTIEVFGGPASLMRSAADNKEVKDLVFNFNGVRSSPDDLMEAVVRARSKN